MTEKWILFKKGQIKQNDGYKYEANVKYRIDGEDGKYYYLGENKFDKTKGYYETGYNKIS